MNNKLSTHVSIYKFPITALSSISTRVSGVYFTGLFIGGGITKLLDKDKELLKIYDNLDFSIKRLFNYSIIVPITYHTYGGIRHFIWDKYPSLLNNKSVTKHSYMLFGGTFITSILTEHILHYIKIEK